MPRATKSNTRRKFRGGSMLTALVPSINNPSLPGGLSSVLPTTSWDRWTPETRQWGPTSEAPAPLANGGLYTNPQSTAVWASSPFPATQNAFALEAAKISGLPEVAYHQRPNDNFGASFSPMVASPITPAHYSASGPMGPIIQKGGKRGVSNKRRSNKKAAKSKRNRFTRK
jgi:hypothetical protein